MTQGGGQGPEAGGQRSGAQPFMAADPAFSAAGRPQRRWMRAWVALALALAAHVADEALTGFLAFYNPLVESVRERIPWIPLPTFTFGVWLAGLIVFVIVLLSLSIFVYDGRRWMIPLALCLSVLMMANAVGHMAMSLYLGRAAPGVTSSPLLFLASAFLLRETLRARRQAGPPRRS